MEKSAAQDMKNLLVTNGMTSRAAGRVVEILEPMGYFEIPASMTYHGAWPGGLFEHSWAVTKQLVCLTDKLGLKWQMRPTAHIMRGTAQCTHDAGFCSNCKLCIDEDYGTALAKSYSYCPHCGAKFGG